MTPWALAFTTAAVWNVGTIAFAFAVLVFTLFLVRVATEKFLEEVARQWRK